MALGIGDDAFTDLTPSGLIAQVFLLAPMR